jgi:hypothetical protein
MKKNYKNLIPALLIACTLQSCATVFGGGVNAYQRTRPLPGQQQRRLRVGAFIADILLFWPGTIVDFATCAIYRPTPAAPENTPPATPPVSAVQK